MNLLVHKYYLHNNNNIISTNITIDNTEGTTVQPIQAEVADSVVILALSPGSQHRVFASAVDNVGNRQSMAEDLMNIIVVDVPLFEGLCPNNCSLRGNCSSFGICTCETGYFGSDCSLGELTNCVSSLKF